MAKLEFRQIEVLLADGDLNIRQSVRNILHEHGFRAMRFAKDFKDVNKLISDKMPDLIISDVDLYGGDLCSMVRSIRNHELGHDPFLPVIAMTWNPTMEMVMKVIESGSDDLIAKPISNAQLFSRITHIFQARKRFLVTSDYIGPVRKKGRYTEDYGAVVEAPNVLKAKASGEKLNPDEIEKAIESINLRKLEQHAVSVGDLVRAIIAGVQMGNYDANVQEKMEKLVYVAEDTARRMVGTKYSHVSGLCMSLIKVSNAVCFSEGEPRKKDLQLLEQLSQAIEAGFFQTDEGSTEAAAQITKTIGN